MLWHAQIDCVICGREYQATYHAEETHKECPDCKYENVLPTPGLSDQYRPPAQEDAPPKSPEFGHDDEDWWKK